MVIWSWMALCGPGNVLSDFSFDRCRTAVYVATSRLAVARVKANRLGQCFICSTKVRISAAPRSPVVQRAMCSPPMNSEGARHGVFLLVNLTEMFFLLFCNRLQ